jgi:hypothetical protein
VLHHSGARAVFVEDAEQLAKVRAVEADLPEEEQHLRHQHLTHLLDLAASCPRLGLEPRA